MPKQIRCPECDTTLRVPDNLLGKSVKCPKCQTTFTADLDEPAETERIAPEPIRASSRRPSRPVEEDEELPPEDEDEERPRRRRRRGRRSSAEAESAVAGPAIAMMVVAGLDIAWGIVDLLLRILGISMIAGLSSQKGMKASQQADVFASMAGGIGGDIVGLCLAALILVGALKMKNLSNYGLAMTACIVSMIPCHACCCLGLPFGIWGLVMLNKPEVKDAFS